LKQCKLVVVRGRAAQRENVFAGDVIRVGKGPDNDLVLDDETVSRSHFELVRDGRGWLVRDLRSTNGTFLDGAEIQSGYVRAGSLIGAGAAKVRVHPFEERLEVPPFEGDALGELRGAAPAMREAFALLQRLAPTEVAVVIEGELGTGKALAARVLHERSRRARGPLVVVDGRAVPAAVEAALFGADSALERASGGTLVLEEPAELPLELQPRLLRTLETRELRRGGGGRARLELRLVATSTRPLELEVEKGKLREGLHARLAPVTVRLPPLRERKEDLALLGAALTGARLPDDVVAELAAHEWPGNLDELRSVLTLGARLGGGFDEGVPFRTLKERWTDHFEARYLAWLLERADGNVSRAARAADMDRKYLHTLLKRHKITAGE
jgi:DNA-binding NtrC family response regulator